MGRERTMMDRMLNPGTVKVSRAIEQWEKRVKIVSIQSATYNF